MDEVKKLSLQCVLFSMEAMKEKIRDAYKPDTLRAYCDCMEQLARTYKIIENMEENTNESN